MDKRKYLLSFFRPLTDKIYYACSDEKKKQLLIKWYEKVCGRSIDLDNPVTFNEKMQWLKLYDSTALKTLLADKYLAREWVANRIGEEHLIPIIGAWDKFSDIDFSALPDQFVLKTNHGSGWNSIVKNKAKMNYHSEKRKFDVWMRQSFTTEYGFELHYMNIPRKIIAEQYMADLDGVITDYRFFCFNGVPQYVWVDNGSGTPDHTRTIYNVDWVKQDYLVNYPPIVPDPEKPETFEEMLQYAKELSGEFCFARVDFYSIKGHVYFGEITFTPQSGTGRWNDEKQNIQYGELIKLPPKSSLPNHIS